MMNFLHSQTTYYVAKNGDNNNPGTEAHPFLSIQKGVDMAGAGDVVFVKAGTYNEEVSITNSGTAGNPVKLSAYPGDELNVIIDGTGINVSKNSAWAYFSGLIGAYDKSHVEVSGFTVQNSNAFGILAHESDHITFEGCYTYNTYHSGIASFKNCSNIYIYNNEVEFAVNGGRQECISVDGTSNFEIAYNSVHDTSEAGVGGEGIDVKNGSSYGKVYQNVIWNTPTDRAGIYIDAYELHTHNIEIYGNTVYDSKHFGINICSEKGGLLEDVWIYNNLIYNNKRGGIQFFDESSHSGPEPIQNIYIYNNTFFNNSANINWWGGITNSSPFLSNIYIHNNIFSGNNAYQVDDQAGANGWNVSNNLLFGDLGTQDQNRINSGDDIQGNPQFLNAVNLDFRLNPSSPAIDQGISSFINTDFDGNPRPSGSGWDIGAFEYAQGPTCNPTIVVSGQSTLCNDGTLTLDAGSGFASYNWSTGETSQSIVINQSGDYTVNTIDNQGCSGNSSVQILFPEAMVLDISKTNAIGQNLGAIDLTVSGGTPPYTFAWSNGETSEDLFDLSADTYTIVVTDSHGCTAQTSVIIDWTEPADLTFEHGVIDAVTETWQTVNLSNTYQSPVVIASVQLSSSNLTPVVTRIKNAGATSFDLKIQGAGQTAVSSYTVHYFVIEEGVYTQTNDGITLEAVKTISTETAKSSNWILEPRAYQNSYSNPVVLGQVMSTNDNDWSVFWASEANSRLNPPSSTSLACGKNISEATGNRADETIGYVVFEAGNGNLNGTNFLVGLGDDIVKGTTNSTQGYTYGFSGLLNPQTAILSAAAIDGANGGWPVLFGDNPLTETGAVLAFEEDVEKDTERNHTHEQVAYLIFDGQQPSINFPTVEYGILENIDTNWQSITFTEAFSNPVIVATPVIVHQNDATVSTRIQNSNSSGFEIKLESPSATSINPSKVYYFVVEEGVYNDLEHGITMEAVLANTSVTARKGNWVREPRNYQNSYMNPVVIGQVMSNNDAWSVFWSSTSTSKLSPPSSSSFAAGKHVAEDISHTRADETIGYIVMESGVTNLNGITIQTGISNDFVRGLSNSSTGYSLNLTDIEHVDFAVLSASGMDGNDGGFPVLFGNNPLASSELVLSFAEDQIKDSERKHTTEQVAFLAIGQPALKSFASQNTSHKEPAFSLNDQKLSLYPNPATHTIFITLDEKELEPNSEVYIYNMMGILIDKIVLKTTVNSTEHYNISVEHLNTGLYIIQAKTNNQIYTAKFLKE